MQSTTTSQPVLPHALHIDDFREQFPPLEKVTRPTVPTEQAGYYLDRRPQTMRTWAMRGHPIRPLRINGRLAWPVAEIRRLLGV